MPDLLDYENPPVVRIAPSQVAPWPHTLFIVAVLGLWAAYGALRSHLPVSVAPHVVTYTGSVIIQYLLVGSTIAGLYHRRQFLSEVFGRLRPEGVAAEAGRGFLIYLCGLGVMLVIGIIMRPSHLSYLKGAVQALLPRNSAELALWMVVSVTAGVCEEFVFRGYLPQQFARWSGSVAVAIGASAVLFGCMHFDEGAGAVVQITGLGAMYGVFAVRRGNLRSVMIAHFLQDALTGIFLYMRSR